MNAHPEPLSISLPATLTIENVETFAAEIKQLPIGDQASIRVDASATEHLTAPGVQLLVALEKALEGHGGRVHLLNPSDSVRRALADMGLSSMLTHTV